MTTVEATRPSERDPLMFDMMGWSAPAGLLRDREVARVSHSLEGEKILLVVTGSIAAIKTLGLVRTLRRYGAEVDVRV